MRAFVTGLAAITAIAFASALASPACADTNIKFSLDLGFQGPSAPFLLALDKGYYQSEGLNVAIDPAARSLEAIERVASGNYDIGFGDINTLIRYRDANPKVPVKAVFMVYNRPAYAVIGRLSRGIRTPKDLEGKKLGVPSTDSAFAQWPILVKANDIDASKVTIENIGFPVREPMLAAGQVDAVTGYSFISYINLKDRGVPVDDLVVLLMADYGVNLYGNAIIVSPKFAADHPDAVKGFLRAFLKGLKETVKSPVNAIGSVIKRTDATARAIELERLQMAIRDNIVTPEVKANGYGNVDAARFAGALEQIGQAYRFKSAKPKAEDIFDASFLPSPADLKFN